MKGIFCCILIGLGNLLGQDRPDPQDPAERQWSNAVVQVKIGPSDLFEKEDFKALDVILNRIESQKPKAVIFDLDSPGGLAFPARELMGRIASLAMPTLSFVNDSAVGAACLIAFSTDRIYVAPDSLIGAAAVVSGPGTEIETKMRAKIENLLDTQLRKVAEQKGHHLELMKAFLFTRQEERTFGKIVLKPGQLLMLNANEATQMVDDEPLLAKAEVADLRALLKIEKLGDERLVTVRVGQ